MRTLSKPSTARCTLEHSTAFLLAEAQSAGCVRLSEVNGGEFAHDAANRFLNREAFSPRDLCEEMRPLIVWEGGILSVDDTVLDKPHSQEGKTDLVGYFWSGLHGKAVKGINLVTLLYGEIGGMRVPVHYRVVDKAEGKTKHDLFREMVAEVLGWGLAPAVVTADSWYSGVENLRFLRDQGLSFTIAREKNRTVSAERGRQAIRNHLFCSLRAFVEPELQRWRGEIKSWYGLKRHLADAVVTSFIRQRTRPHSA